MKRPMLVPELGNLPDEAVIITTSMRWTPERIMWGIWELYALDLSGNATRITFDERNYHHAAVSPNRRYIAATTSEGVGLAGLWMYDLKAKTEVRLLGQFYSAGIGGVDWSPDGRYIYFAAKRTTEEPPDVYRMRPNGGQRRNLTKTPDFFESDVALSADGSLIAFVRMVPTGASEMKPQIWVMSEDGGDQRMVDDGGPEVGVYRGWPIGSFDPEFSPNGSWVVYSRTDTDPIHDQFGWGAHKIMVRSIVDSEEFDVLTDGALTIIPDWKDQTIIYTEFKEDEYVGMVEYPLGGEVRRIEGPFPNIWNGSRDGKFIPYD